jgi:hypothetical protein
MDRMTDEALCALLKGRTGADAAATRDLESAADPYALRDDERQRCEVWTRVMGYHRPVASFNIGKKGEHRERQFFREPAADAVSRAAH